MARAITISFFTVSKQQIGGLMAQTKEGNPSWSTLIYSGLDDAFSKFTKKPEDYTDLSSVTFMEFDGKQVGELIFGLFKDGKLKECRDELLKLI